MIINDFSKIQHKLLFTPGPLTTSMEVKKAALTDLGSRDSSFISYVQEIRSKLLDLAHVASPEYEAIIIQGSGTFGIEATISSAIPSNGLLLNIINGAYGHRISQIARIHSIPLLELIYDENCLPDLHEIESVLENHPEITHIAIVHGETTTGLLNPIAEIGEIATNFNKSLIVDAMSTFGAYEVDVKKLNISYIVSSSNKCIEGIPGFSFVIAKSAELIKCKGQARTLSLDLYAQWLGLDLNGQFRFTPPVQALLAFHTALLELEKEGGVRARGGRYAINNAVLTEGMKTMGFKQYLPDKIRSYIITSFLYPAGPNFTFEEFYKTLNDKNCVIYPGKLSKVDCFRIGNIGQLYPEDIKTLLLAIKETISELNISFDKETNLNINEFNK